MEKSVLSGCTEPGWGRVNFLYSSLYGATIQICGRNSVDNAAVLWLCWAVLAQCWGLLCFPEDQVDQREIHSAIKIRGDVLSSKADVAQTVWASVCSWGVVRAFASWVLPHSLIRLSLSWPTEFHHICFFLCSPLSSGQGMSEHCRVFICWLGSGLLTPPRSLSPFSSAFIAECGVVWDGISLWLGQASCPVVSCPSPMPTLAQLAGEKANPEHCKRGSAIVRTLVCYQRGIAWAYEKKINSIAGRPRTVVIFVAVSWGLSPKMCSCGCTVRVIERWNKLPGKVCSLHPWRCSGCDWRRAQSNLALLSWLWAEVLAQVVSRTAFCAQLPCGWLHMQVSQCFYVMFQSWF